MADPKNNPVTGASYLLKGLSLIRKKGVKRYVALPLAINVLLFVFAVYFAFDQVQALDLWIDEHLPGWLEWLTWLLYPLFVLAVLLVVFFGFSVMANIVAAPFNGFLADAVERHLTGAKAEGSGRGVVREVLVALYAELRKLLYFVTWAIPLLILSLIPGLNIAAPLLWAFFGAWMLAVEYTDYPMGNHGITFPQQKKILAGRRYLSLGFGGMATVAMMIPVVNFLVIPVAVAGATALWVDQLKGQTDLAQPWGGGEANPPADPT